MFTISCSLFLYRNAQSNFYLFNQVTVHYSEEFLWGFSNKSEITLFVSVQHSRDDWFPNPNWRDAKEILSNILLHQLSYFVNYRCIQCSMLYDLFLFWIYKAVVFLISMITKQFYYLVIEGQVIQDHKWWHDESRLSSRVELVRT